jgi:hypothetical protein
VPAPPLPPFRALQTAVVALAVVATLIVSGSAESSAIADQKAALLAFAKSAQSNFWKWATTVPTKKWTVATDPCADQWDFVTCGEDGDITYVAHGSHCQIVSVVVNMWS